MDTCLPPHHYHDQTSTGWVGGRKAIYEVDSPPQQKQRKGWTADNSWTLEGQYHTGEKPLKYFF